MGDFLSAAYAATPEAPDAGTVEIERILALSPEDLRAELVATGIDPDQAVRDFDRVAERAIANADLLRAVFDHMLAVAATPIGEPIPVHPDAEVERLVSFSPLQLADELVARRVTFDPDYAAEIVNQAVTAALKART